MVAAVNRQSRVVATFEDRGQADRAVGELRQAGFPEDQIRIDESRLYQGRKETSRTSVTILANGRSREAAAILDRLGSKVELHGVTEAELEAQAAEVEAEVEAAPAVAVGDAPSVPADGVVSAPVARVIEGTGRLRLLEEQLHVRKEFAQTGEVRVRKAVIVEHQTFEVPVRREEIVIERHAPTGEVVAVKADFRDGEEIRVPVCSEQVIIEKRPVVTQELTVGKRVVAGTERVGTEFRREEVRIEREGDVFLSGDTLGSGSSVTAGAPIGVTTVALGGAVGTAAGAPISRVVEEGAERIQVREERVNVRTQPVEAGAVRVRKVVVVEHKTLEVPVRREEIVIEQQTPAGEVIASEADFRDGEEIRIPVRRELITIEKRPVITEEVTVGKRVVAGTERVDSEVCKEEVHIGHEGEVSIRGGAIDRA